MFFKEQLFRSAIVIYQFRYHSVETYPVNQADTQLIYMSGFMKTRLKDGYQALCERFFLAINYLQSGRYKN